MVRQEESPRRHFSVKVSNPEKKLVGGAQGDLRTTNSRLMV